MRSADETSRDVEVLDRPVGDGTESPPAAAVGAPRRVRFSRPLFHYMARGLAVNFLVSFLVLEAVQGIILTIRATEGYSFDFLIIFPVLLRAFGQALNYTLPIALLFGTGLFVGRLNADQEITALRSFGLAPSHLVAPALAIGLLCAGVALGLSHELIPRLRFANRNVGLLILEHLGYLGEGWNYEFHSGSRSLWVHHYDGPNLEGIFFSVSGEGEDAPISQDALSKVDAQSYPVFLFAERARVRRGEGDQAGTVIVDLQGVSTFFDNDFVFPDKPSDFMNLARIESLPLPLRFRYKDPSVKDMARSELRRERQRRWDALEEATQTNASLEVQKSLAAVHAECVTEVHRRNSIGLAALTFPLTAFLIGLVLRSRNRLLPSFYASVVCPAIYFSCAEIAPGALAMVQGGAVGVFGASVLAWLPGPWIAEHLGNGLLLGLCGLLWLRLQRGPR